MQPIQVAAEGRVTVRWEADLSEAFPTANDVQMTVSAVDETRTPALPLVVRLIGR